MKNVPAETLRHNIKYLDLLSRSFPNVTAAVEEVVNLKAILNLPKGTEHFLTDIHGEAEAFNHVMQNASGAIRRKVSEELRKKKPILQTGTSSPFIGWYGWRGQLLRSTRGQR